MTEVITERVSKKVSPTQTVLTKAWCCNRRFRTKSTTETCVEELCAVYYGCVAYEVGADGGADVTCSMKFFAEVFVGVD